MLVIVAMASGLLAGCGGSIGNIPSDFSTYAFQASVVVMTTDPQPGRRVDFNVAVTSTGNTPVHCDVTLRVVGADTSEIYSQVWTDVLFEPKNEWNLTNGFLPATDVKKTYNLEIEVRRHDNGELLLDLPMASVLTFPQV